MDDLTNEDVQRLATEKAKEFLTCVKRKEIYELAETAFIAGFISGNKVGFIEAMERVRKQLN